MGRTEQGIEGYGFISELQAAEAEGWRGPLSLCPRAMDHLYSTRGNYTPLSLLSAAPSNTHAHTFPYTLGPMTLCFSKWF